MINLLFTSGTARGGTNIRTFYLNSHDDICLSIDALLPLFKYFRSRLIYPEKWTKNQIPSNWSAPLPDLFNNPPAVRDYKIFCERIEDISIPKYHWSFLLQLVEERTALANSILQNDIKLIQSNSFIKSLNIFLEIVSRKFAKPNPKIFGLQENWLIEFFQPLSIIYPQAKFISYIRDPRAVIHSSEFHEPNFKKHPAVFSMLRHIRKHLFLTTHLNEKVLTEKNFLITSYENFFNSPNKYCDEITNFLDIKPGLGLPSDVDFVDGHGLVIDKSLTIYKNAVDNWKSEGRNELAESANWILETEIKNYGYQLEEVEELSQETINYLVKNMKTAKGWKEFEDEIEQQIKWEKKAKSLQKLRIPNLV